MSILYLSTINNWQKVLFEGSEVKAIDLSGSSGLLFITNSLTGAVEASKREGKKVELNPALHAN